MKRILIITMFCLVLVFGCGGGGGNGDSSSSESTSAAEGLYNGTTDNGRAISYIVLNDGTYWALYSLQGDSSIIAGAVQGNSSSKNGSFSSSNGRDFNLEGLGINGVTVNASYQDKQSLNGSLRYTSTEEQVSFASTYDPDYEQTPDLNAIAGTYSGSAATSGDSDSATFTVSPSGAISGLSALGCSFSGTATPRASGNVYNISIQFHGGNCANGSSTVTGIAYFDASINQLYSMALNGSRTDGFIYVGVKE